ncbi:MAG: type II secretion system F family protein [Fimbriimonadaceae bacterium]
MTYFRYQYTDNRGQTLEGTIQAKSESDAAQLLQQRGIANVRLITSPGVTQNFAQLVRTKKGTDRQRFFLFSQVAKQLNAGISPATCFAELARITSEDHFRPSFLELSEAATNGNPLTDVLVKYADLYPDNVVGTIHAAEQGGFLPEAFSVLSAQAEDAHKFKRFHWFVWYLGPRMLIAVPFVFGVRAALLESAKGLGDPPFPVAVIKHMTWPYGPMILALFAILWILRSILGTYEMRRFRHRMGLRVPIYGARARNECIAVFTWVLSRLARAGVAPNSSWQMATEAVPNLEMAARLRETGRMMQDGSRLSDAIFGSKLFPSEYAPVVSTGELTGDMEGALDQLERISRTEFETTTAVARIKSVRLGCLFAVITSGVILIVLVYAWYNEMYGVILDNFKID